MRPFVRETNVIATAPMVTLHLSVPLCRVWERETGVEVKTAREKKRRCQLYTACVCTRVCLTAVIFDLVQTSFEH